MRFSKLYKVKAGKVGVLREWCEVLSGERRQEALATFDYENVSRETFVLFAGRDGEYYAIGLNEVTGEHKAGDLEVQINQEHKRVREECLEPISDNGEVLLDLQL